MELENAWNNSINKKRKGKRKNSSKKFIQSGGYFSLPCSEYPILRVSLKNYTPLTNHNKNQFIYGNPARQTSSIHLINFPLFFPQLRTKTNVHEHVRERAQSQASIACACMCVCVCVCVCACVRSEQR